MPLAGASRVKGGQRPGAERIWDARTAEHGVLANGDKEPLLVDDGSHGALCVAKRNRDCHSTSASGLSAQAIELGGGLHKRGGRVQPQVTVTRMDRDKRMNPAIGCASAELTTRGPGHEPGSGATLASAGGPDRRERETRIRFRGEYVS